ncbi:MAG: deoxyribose-phosphate aldolase [Actinobacteria bacterium]|nr:deoxyribose-phosphate aldolase [Actinomycetota bacterium]
MSSITLEALTSAIDQTLLRPVDGLAFGTSWLERNAEMGFAALCVPPFLVPAAARILSGSATQVCSVCAFPLGYALQATKAEEARQLVLAGATEVDVVINLGALIEGDDDYVLTDLRSVVEAVASASGDSAIVKVILETGYLTAEQIVRGSRLTVEAGAHFVKTSTGFGPRGASVDDVRTMREAVGEHVGVKASGGIRDLETALEMLEAGANRLGTSSGDAIVAAFRERLG